jgi:radical SAM protein with 4Fe4S-binding SPASM domain
MEFLRRVARQDSVVQYPAKAQHSFYTSDMVEKSCPDSSNDFLIVKEILFMLYRQKNDTFIRIFGGIGYIVNKSTLQDYITDSSGAVFLKALSRDPKTIDKIIEEIVKSFSDVKINEIKNDAIEFYSILEESGFIVSGTIIGDLQQKDQRFSYKNLMGNAVKDNHPSLVLPANETQNYLENHLKTNPQLMSFQIELTSRCNERCVHCYIPHENKMTDIEPSLYYKVLEQCHNMNVLDITLSGGEALLHPEFNNFLRKAKEYDLSVSILSNLTLLNDKIISAMKEGLLCSVQVSLYSMNPQIHDAITKLPGSFENTKAAILKLIENDIPVQISCPTMKQNKNCYKDVLNWAHKHKCRVQTDYIMMAQSDLDTRNLANRLSLDETKNIINDIVENDIVYQQRLLSSEFDETYAGNKDIGDDLICGVCTSTLCMVADGGVYPCAGWQDYIVGNVKDTSLKDLWENAPKVKYLRGLRRKDFPECLNCADRGFCSLCMVRNANEDPNGNFFNINRHFCEVAAINRKIVIDWRGNHQQ